MPSASTGTAVMERGLTVLECVANEASPVSLAELARRTGLPKATAHRLVSVLVERGYVGRAGSDFVVGMRCFELGSRWVQSLDLRSVAATFLSRLNQATGETVHLAVYEGGDVVYIDKRESLHAVAAKSHVGRRCPAFCVATGRALLAYQPSAELTRLFDSPLPNYTDATITDPAELDRMLEHVRDVGYAVNHQSYRDGVGGLAAPISDRTGKVIASVGVCLPEIRFTDERFDTLRDETVAAASAISSALGRSHTGAPGSAGALVGATI